MICHLNCNRNFDSTNPAGFRSVYEQNVTLQKNKEFFVHLKKLQPYYKVQEWEKDYQKQVSNNCVTSASVCD